MNNISIAEQMLQENSRRQKELNKYFNPITGQGSIGERVQVNIIDHSIPIQFLPIKLLQNPLVAKINQLGSISALLNELNEEPTPAAIASVRDLLIRIRITEDFPFWAYTLTVIKNKLGGDDIQFRLNYPQRILISALENLRNQNKPIRIILLKARQWGGSTAIQIYIAWIQLVHLCSWNSLIVGHVKDASAEVRDMFQKLLDQYPIELLYPPTIPFNNNDPKIAPVTGSTNIWKIPQRNCKIKIGSAENPNSARGGDSAMVHCTEVAFWKKTEGKTPEQIVRSACSGVPLKPLSIIVYESTPNGTGNFFHREYISAKNNNSSFTPLFIPWFQIEMYQQPLGDNLLQFATELYQNRLNETPPSNRQESGKYLFSLWEKGATLENINWYIQKRAEFFDHADIASEYPSDDIEAFAHSGENVFDRYKVELLRQSCKQPALTGEISADASTGKNALQNIQFKQSKHGKLHIWQLPETYEPNTSVSDRYVVAVDIGGRSLKADYSVILVLDRYWMADGERPEVVAQWRGHTDHDLLAWKATQIASFYHNALLIFESNTLESKANDRFIEGDPLPFILDQVKEHYDNLYARPQSPEAIVAGAPKKWGFHTNSATKPRIIDMLNLAIREQLYIERDENAINEFLTFERKPNGATGASDGNHDDLLMARAIALTVCFQEMPTPRIITRDSAGTPTTKRKKAISEASLF